MRPNDRTDVHEPMADHAFRTRDAGLPFDTTGPVEGPGALVPVMCDAEHGTATYVEPNVWVRHPISQGPASELAHDPRG